MLGSRYPGQSQGPGDLVMCMIKIFKGRGVADGEGSGERCLKWGGGGH